MKAGKLRTLLSIQSRTDTADGMGGVVSAWAEVCKVYGRQLVDGRDWKATVSTEADQRESVQACRWETRFYAGIAPEMRLVTGCRIFEINSVFDPSQKRERLILVCIEKHNAGVTA